MGQQDMGEILRDALERARDMTMVMRRETPDEQRERIAMEYGLPSNATWSQINVAQDIARNSD